MLMPAREALPTRPIPNEIKGNDTREQAAANRRQVTAYLALLTEKRLPLPMDPTGVKRVGIAQVAKEAGVSLGVLRPGHPCRAIIEASAATLGLAPILKSPDDADASIATCRRRFQTMAPMMAGKLGITPEAMSGFVAELFDCMTARADGDESTPASGLLEQLKEDEAAGMLALSTHARRIVRSWETWVLTVRDDDLGGGDDAATEMAFHDLLSLALHRAQLSQARAAEISGVPQPTLHKWLHEERHPNRRSFKGLRKLAAFCRLPEDALVQAIARSTGGDGLRVRLDDFPEGFRASKWKQLRDLARGRLTEDDLHLPGTAFRARLAEICDALVPEFEDGIARKKMRDANAVDQNRLPDRLKAELACYQNELTIQGRAEATVTSYTNHLLGFFSFALSGACPAELSVDVDRLSIIHAGSTALWEAYFRHLNDIGRAHMGASFQISRAMVDRMSAVSAMFGPHGFIDGQPTLTAALREIGNIHVPMSDHLSWSICSHDARLEATQIKVLKFQKKWKKLCSQPLTGRDEIADLLAQNDPLIAVRHCVAHLRAQLKTIRKWKGTGEGRRPSHHYATALRKLVLVHLLGQTALRIGMVPSITVGGAKGHLQWPRGGEPMLTIPAALFKNEASEVFKTGPYIRKLVDIDGFHADLKEYLEFGRPCLLAGAKDDHLLLKWSSATGCGPVSAAVTRNEITALTAAAIGIGAPADKRLIRARHLRPHHFRDILATSILRRTNRNYALAGDAIHVTEQTAREYYARDTVEDRRPMLMEAFEGIASESRTPAAGPQEESDHKTT